MDALKITVITPSFNQGHFIEETITSVLDQNYPNLEYLVIDGGSTDNTVEIIRKYEKHINYWVSEKDKGQSDAISKGFSRATGEIINWLNSDDYYEKGTLQKVALAFSDKKTNVFCGRSRVFGIGVPYLNNGTDVYTGNLEKTVGWARIDQPETFFRHSVLKEIGYLNNFLHYTMDKEMWIRYLLKFGLNNIKRTDDTLVHYRLHDYSKTVSLQKGFTEETRNLYYTYAKWFGLSNYKNFFQTHFPVSELPLKYYEGLLDKNKANAIVNYYFMLQALSCYASDDYKKAKEYIATIKSEQLDLADKKEIDKIKFRMKIPLGVKRALKFFNKQR